MKLELPHPKLLRSFPLQMNLEKVDQVTYRSTSGAFPWAGEGLVDGEMRPSAYGGHVYAQAVWAAAQTVGTSFLVHSVTGYWLAQGLPDIPFVYTVKAIRDGKSYCTRAVEVTQPGCNGPCFTCTSSFKQPEISLLEVQAHVRIDEEYVAVLQGKAPKDFPVTTEFTDAHGFLAGSEPITTPSFPGLNMSLLPMKAYNDGRAPLDRRHVFFYTPLGPLPSAPSNPNMHACAHLYASDRESLFVVLRHLKLARHCKQMKSLSQTVIFHAAEQALSACDQDGKARWFCQEVWTDRVGDGRCTHHSRIWDQDGRHIATTTQDGLMKLSFDDEDDLARVKSFTSSKPKL